MDRYFLKKIFVLYNIIDVIYFVGLKFVFELIKDLFFYYQNNVIGILVLFEEMCVVGVNSFIFSFLVIVYGNLDCVLFNENFCMGGIINLYGIFKYMVEQILEDFL